MKRAAQALAVLLVAVLAGFGSISLVERVKQNSESAEVAEAAPRALEKACQNLNEAIKATQSPEVQAYNELLVREIREQMAPAERVKADRLAKKAAKAGVHRTPCKQLVERAFP